MLSISDLGPLQVAVDGQQVNQFISTKAQALLCYLAVTRQAHSRHALAGLLWPEDSEAKAKNSLRVALANLRKLLPQYIDATRQTVGISSDRPYSLDSSELFDLLRHSDTADLQTLQNAARLIRGEFLQDLQTEGTPAFDDWVNVQRTYWRDASVRLLSQLADRQIEKRFPAEAITTLQQLLQLDPWQENAYRQLMISYSTQGDYNRALAEYETCRRILTEKLGVQPEPETTTLFERIQAAREGRPFNLPPPTGPFFGREDEENRIRDILLYPANRLVTITGIGGIGKTQLALSSGRRLNDEAGLHFVNGITYVPLQGVEPGSSASDAIATAVAGALGIYLPGRRPPAQEVLEYLQPEDHLLILDNFEHLLDGVGWLSNIVTTCPEVKLLVTSREALNLMAEWRIALQGLPYPGPSRRAPSISRRPETFAAVQLFVQSAKQARPTFSLTPQNTGHVIDLCRLVMGMPLAIKLAASWLQVIPTEQLAIELGHNLDLLSTRMRDVPERQRRIRAVFDQTWELLEEDEKQVLAGFSIFRGGFSREAAAEIMALREAPLLAILTRLSDKSLILRGTGGRFEMHELLRQYAAEKLQKKVEGLGEQDLETGDAWQRYSSYYLNFVSLQAERLSGDSPKQAINALRLDLDNVRQAWQWAVKQERLAELGMATEGLSRFYDRSGLFSEGAELFGRAVAVLQSQVTGSDQDLGSLRQETIVRLAVDQARFLLRVGKAQQALELAAEMTDLANTLQVPSLKAQTLLRQGESCYYMGRYPQAKRYLQETLALAQTAQLPDLISQAQFHLGVVAQYQGLFEEAQNWMEQARQGFEALGDLRSLSLVLMNLGGTAVHLGDHGTGRRFFEGALKQVRETGDRWIEGMLLNNLGVIAYEEGRYSEAESACRQSLDITRRLKDRSNEAFLLHSLANIARDQGDYTSAEQLFHQCLKLCRENNDRDTESYALADWGLLLHNQDQQEMALEYSRQAAALAEELKKQVTQSLALTHSGHALLALGRAEKAGGVFAQSVILRRAAGEHHRAIESQAGVAAAMLDQGDRRQSLAEIDEILAYLSGQPLTGLIEPFRVYLTCCRVLEANQDPRYAEVLATAYHRLQERAVAIENAELRTAYLEKVSPHYEIVARFNQSQVS